MDLHYDRAEADLIPIRYIHEGLKHKLSVSPRLPGNEEMNRLLTSMAIF